MSTYHWSYEDLLGNYDFWMPLNGNDNANTTAAMTLTKQSGADLTFVSDTIKGNTQVLNLDTSATAYEYYTYTGTSNSKYTNAKYDDGWGLEFWIKVSAYPTSNKTILETTDLGLSINTDGTITVDWGSSTQSTTKTLSLDTWHLITLSAISRTGFPSTSRNLIYLDGICINDNAIVGLSGMPDRTSLFKFSSGTYSSSIKIAHFAQWINNAPMPREIINRYQYLNSKTNYNTYVGADNPKLWLTSNTTMGTLAANIWSLAGANPGSGLSFRTDGRWEGAVKQTSPFTGQWDHAVTFGTPTTDISNWFYNGNWSIEFWHKNEMGSGSNYTAANQHFALYASNPLCIIRNVANSYLPGFTVRYGNTAITPTVNTTAGNSIAASQYATGEWNHYVLTSEWNSETTNGTLKLYYNGNLALSQTFTRASLANTGADATMTNIGIGFISNSGSIRNNSYDDLILYDTVLTQSDVLDRYYAELMYERDVRHYEDNIWKIAKNTLTYDGTCWIDWDRHGVTKYWNGTAWVNL